MIKQFLTYGTVFCSVEHTVDKDSSEVFYALQLKKRKKELIIESKEEFSLKDALYKSLTKQKHVFLIVNNQQVLLKTIDTLDASKEQIVKTAFPSIKVSEFYYEVLQSKEHSFVAVCRKEYVDNLITEYQSQGIYIIGFSLQNLTIQSLIPFVKHSEIKTSNSIVSLENNEIASIRKIDLEETNLNINNLEISNKYTLTLSGVLSYFYSKNTNLINFNGEEKKLKADYNNFQFYSLGIKTALGVVFSILLINFIFFSSAHSKMTQLNFELLANSSSKNTLIQLQNNVNKKEELTKSITSLSSSKTTWYLNELGKSVPRELQLTAINYQPLSKSIQKNKEIDVTTNIIVVKGISKDNNSFSNWISKLELKDWINDVVVISYGRGKKNIAEFELTISVKN
jgi:Tfp pilus assembly protein PilN